MSPSPHSVLTRPQATCSDALEVIRMSAPAESRTGLDVRSEVAVRGVAIDPPTSTAVDLGSTIPLGRPRGAGPSHAGHVLVDGLKTTLPINPASPFRLRDGRLVRTRSDGGGTALRRDVAPGARPPV